jgi:hypothetical protein
MCQCCGDFITTYYNWNLSIKWNCADGQTGISGTRMIQKEGISGS